MGGGDHLGAGGAQVEEQADLAGDDDGGVRVDVEFTARGVQRTRIEIVDEVTGGDDQAGGTEQRIAAVTHQRRTAVSLFPGDAELDTCERPTWR